MRRTASLLMLLMIPGAATEAGPWPRAAGTTFVSLRSGAENGNDGTGATAGLYAEHGRTERLTLGFELDYSANSDTPTTIGTFGRWHLWSTGQGHPVSLGLGISTEPGTDDPLAAIRIEPAVHVGYGFASRWGSGWARLSLSAEIALFDEALYPYPYGQVSFDVTEVELYGQVGLNATENTIVMLGATRTTSDGETYTKIAPAIGRKFGDKTTLSLSLSQELGSGGTRGFSLSLWRTF